MNSKICNVPDRKANSFCSNNCPYVQNCNNKKYTIAQCATRTRIRPEDEDGWTGVRPRVGRDHVPGTADRVLAPGAAADDQGAQARQDPGHHGEDARQQLGVARGRQDRLR